jgi:manganese efflux pump family protein
MLSLMALAIALAMDAMAVSAAQGFAAPRLRARDALTVAFFYGGAQFAMPLVGWFLGDRLGRYVEPYDHWIAFGLLSLIGAKMIREAVRGGQAERTATPFAMRHVLVLALATSIDALAAGLTLTLLDFHPLASAATIGLVTAVCSALGTVIGRRVGARIGVHLEWIGGLLLILVGARILLEHLWA